MNLFLTYTLTHTHLTERKRSYMYLDTTNPDVLRAVNRIITSIGESPVTTLTDVAHNTGESTDAYNALQLLDTYDKRIQSKGWTINTLENTELPPDIHTGEIRLNTKSVLLILTPYYTVKAGRLAKQGKTTFDTPQTLTLIVRLPFDELPAPYQDLIIESATLDFQTSYFGLGELTQLTQAKIESAWMDCQQHDISTAGYNIFEQADIRHFLNRRI
jgi:tail tubular protein A|nr:MAG TPA: tail tubular protein [Caudoviricetes sp.]